MPAVTTRPATPADLDFIVSLIPSFASIGLPPWRDAQPFLGACEEWLRKAMDEGATVLIAEDEAGTPLGFIHLHPVTDLTGRPRGHVGDVAVAEAAQGLGVGRVLMAEAEAWARVAGYEYLGLTAIATNERALGFYEHLGYGRDSISLVKRLDDDRRDAARC
jgi:ribosomal protein S18 acetylase RimI-like enzyme